MFEGFICNKCSVTKGFPTTGYTTVCTPSRHRVFEPQMAYSRHTIIYFDTEKKDDMLSVLVPQIDQLAKDGSGVIGARISEGGEDCLVVYIIYENRESAELMRSKEHSIEDSVGGLVLRSPNVVEGQIIWGIDGNDQSLTAEIGHYAKEIIPPRYVKHHLVDIPVSTYDSLIAEIIGSRERFLGIRGLIRLRVTCISEHQIIVTIIYNDKESSEKEDCIEDVLSELVIFDEKVALFRGHLMWSSSYAEAVFGGRFIN